MPPARSRARQFILIGIFLLAGAVFTIWSLGQPQGAVETQDETLLGSRVYAQSCAGCHGPVGEGQSGLLGLDRNSRAWQKTDGQLQRLVLAGGQGMPSFQGQLTGEEIVAVIRYFQSWWDEAQRADQQARSLQDPLLP